jgi:hypothetical protein
MPRYETFGRLDTQMVSAGDTIFATMNNRLRPDQLQAGQVAYSQNGRMDIDGAWQQRKGIDFFGGNLTTSSESLVIPFYLYASKVISSATRSGATVTVVTSTAHGFTTLTQVGVAGLTGTVDPNGNRTITLVNTTTFTFTITGATGSETYSGSGTVGTGFLSGNNNAAYGSCLFSDPSDDNAEYIILALNDKALAVSIPDGTATDIAYPATLSIGSPVRLLQAFKKIYIFRDGATALEWNGSFAGTPAFTKVANGTRTQPVYLDGSNNVAIVDGVVTVTQATHGFLVGDRIYVINKGTTSLVQDGDGYTVSTVPTTGTLTFFAQVPDSAATSVVLSRRISEGLGFTYMPAPPWGAYHQRRLIVPFYYTTTGTSGSETITSRNVRDEILFSDIFDGDTYDQLQTDFKITAGIADYVQFVHPFTNDQALVFNRNSIHLINGLSGSLLDITINEVTREAGLVAQKSVVTIGNSIYFLSDNGVYATSFGELYNLRGAGMPLSNSIEPIIKRINSDYASNAVAVYHDNRYWIAVPLDTSAVNNALLVYNVLNQGWESIDVITEAGWDIANLISAGSESIKRLYAVNRFGGVHIIDGREDDIDLLALGAGVSASAYPVDSYVTTRQYNMGMTDRKKFQNFELQVESSSTNASNASISVETENLDSNSTIGTIAGYLDEVLPVSEDASIRGRIGNIRGYGIQMTVTPTQGRPKLRMTKINGVPAFNSLTSAT